MKQCADTGNPLFCNLIHRDANGSLWLSPNGYMSQTQGNIGSQSTSGIDIGAAYRLNMASMGTLNFVMNGTYLKTLKTQSVPGINAGDDTYDCAGYYGATCGTPNPTWRHKFRATWSSPWKVELSGTWRHLASVKDDALNSSQILAGTVNPIEAELGARDYFDVYAAYPLTKGITLSGGINNLLDKDPPLASSNVLPGVTGSGNTFPQVYDTLGRKLFLNVSAKF
jgi:iron complex outermembrane recepter protein